MKQYLMKTVVNVTFSKDPDCRNVIASGKVEPFRNTRFESKLDALS